MAIYHHPPLPFIGGPAPHIAAKLSPSIEAVPVNDAPTSNRGRGAIAAELVTLWQPELWTFSFFGARQPFTPKALPPGAPGQSADLPPMGKAERFAVAASELFTLAQPDPWTFNFAGNAQPFMRRLLPPAVSAAPADNPPFSLGGPVASLGELLAIAQPDRWTYTLAGGLQPYGGRVLTPVLLSISVNDPPFTHRERFVVAASELFTVAQPNPWTFAFTGSGQPFGPRTLPPSISDVRVDNPPFGYGGPIATVSSLIALAQPDPWVFNFSGGLQPFAPRRLNPTELLLDPSPTESRGRSVAVAEILALNQPDPWTFTFSGARQPFGPGTLAASITAVREDAPPPSSAARGAMAAELLALTQPDPWTFNFSGAGQPFGPKILAADLTAVPEDMPPSSLGGPFTLLAELVALGQPAPWQFEFIGAAQPYAPPQLNPLIIEIDDPPVVHRGRGEVSAQIVSMLQPAIWRFDFEGARQPYGPRTLNPSISAVRVDNPVPAHSGRGAIAAELLALNQRDPWQYTFVGGQQPYGPYLAARYFITYTFAVIIG